MRINTPQISHQTIEGEVVVINLENGCYYSLQGFSAAIWHHIDAGHDRDAIAGAVARAYPGTSDAGEQAAGFVDGLIAEGLVVEAAAPREATAPAVAFPDSFAPPVIEKFTDMQELLMLDPIHEVDEMGWPHKPADS